MEHSPEKGRGASVEYLPHIEWRLVRLPSWAGAGDRFVLSEVCGDSLTEAGIYDGDMALIHLNPDAIVDGDLVYAHTPEGTLIKFLSQQNGRIGLAGSSGHFRYYRSREVKIKGKVIRVECNCNPPRKDHAHVIISMSRLWPQLLK